MGMSIIIKRPALSRGLVGRFAAAVAAPLALLLAAGHSSGQELLQLSAPLLTSQGTSAAGQDISPLPTQRVSALDGSTLGRGGLPVGGANPFANDPAPRGTIADISLVNGAYSPFAVDYVGTARGDVGWVIGRTYSQVQSAGSGLHTSNGYQGKNWHQASQPELRLRAGAGGDGLDAIELILGADRLLQYQQTATNANTYQGVNGAAGIIERTGSGTSMMFTLRVPHGTTIDFFGTATSGGRANLQLWRIVNADGRMAFVGHGTNIVTAADDGYDSDKRIQVAYDGSLEGATGAVNDAGRRYTYGYTADGSVQRLTQVRVESRNGSNWTSTKLLATVNYTYYGVNQLGTGNGLNSGTAGQLESASVVTPNSLSGTAEDTTRRTYYRYYTGAFNASTNPGNSGNMMLVVGPEGSRAYKASSGFQVYTASQSELEPHALAKFDYPNNDSRIYKFALNGECGCSGSSNGTHELTYVANTSSSRDAASYDTSWATRTIVKQPDNSYLAYQFDEAGQTLTRVLSENSPISASVRQWVTLVRRDSNGWVNHLYTPASVLSFDNSFGNVSDGVTPRSGSSGGGLHHQYARSSTAPLSGFVISHHVAENAGVALGAGTKTGATTYTSAPSLAVGSVTLYRPLVTTSRAYFGSGTSDFDETTYGYTYWGTSGNNALVVKSATTTAPAVSPGKNGNCLLYTSPSPRD